MPKHPNKNDGITQDAQVCAINYAVAQQTACQNDFPRGSKSICLFFDQPSYPTLMLNSMAYRLHIEEQYAVHPELFPSAMEHGFELLVAPVLLALRSKTRKNYRKIR